ncbi:hypothetical protein KLP28_01980 [Nocardioidaceae bacterium]|nr:hypothetical protein KLP28_01980 [Nocardioidaceae bacterium]
MPMHSLELLCDPDGDEVVRAQWQALRDADLPSQLDHAGSSNAPHLTVVAAPILGEDALAVARVRLGNLLPVTGRTGGLVLLGGDPVTIARSVELDDDAVRKVLAVRTHVPDRRHDGWLPHVSLVRRLPREQLGRALEVLHDVAADEVAELRFTALRHWDPDAEQTTLLAGPGL